METLLIIVALLLVVLLLVAVGGGVFIYLKWQEKQKVPKVTEESVEDVVKSLYDLQDPKEKRRYEQLMRAWYWNGEVDDEEE